MNDERSIEKDCRVQERMSQMPEWEEAAPASTRPSLEMWYQREDVKFGSHLGRVAEIVNKWKKKKSIKLIFSCAGVRE